MKRRSYFKATPKKVTLRRPIPRKSKSESALLKDEIQAMVRAIVIARDHGCILEFHGPPCNGYDKKGHLILQADHLITRANSATYADTRLIVCVCKGHHGWKNWHKNEYDAAVRMILPPDRLALWDKAEKMSWKPAKMNWKLELAALKQEYECLLESMV